VRLRPDALRSAHARSVWPCRALIFGFGLTLLGSGAFSQTKPPLQFAIPARPLAAALDAYSRVTGLELFYDGELVIGRRSKAIEGLLAPDAALRELLAGSGLVARGTGPNSFTISPALPSRVADTTYQSYFAAIQMRVSQVLCGRAETRPGPVDLLIQLWIASSGTVQRVQLLDKSDDDARENAFVAALRGVPIGTTPPTGLPQPIIMAVLARADGEPNGCADASTAVH
jgi:hypothetical protein